MSKKKKQSDQTTTRRGVSHPLSLAVAAASLGMTMGINPSDVLATPEQVEKEAKVSTAVISETQRLAAVYVKIDGIKGESSDKKKKNKPTAAYPKVERPGTAFPKVEQPGAKFPKVEQPGVAFPKVENPAAAFPKVERPGAEFPKVERPAGKFLKY